MTVTLGFDTETRGLDWFDADHRAFLVSWADDTGGYVSDTSDPEGVARFRAAVERADRLVAHNLSFDVHHVREALGLDLLLTGKELVDTDLLARVALPERRTAGDDNNDRGTHGYKLKHLAKTYLRADAQKAENTIQDLADAAGIKLKSTGGYYDTWRAYPEEMEHYALLDAEYARDLLPILESKLDGRNAQCWEIETELAPILIAAEQRGVQVDQDVVRRLKVAYEPLAADAYDTVTRELGEDALEGNDSLREALLMHGVPLHRKTPTGQLATNKFALQEFEDNFPVLRALSEWRQYTKFLSTYIGPLENRDVVHPSFWQQGAWTGRMSCSRPNMQNIPARAGNEVREIFVPREGHCFVVCDYDSIEVRLLAYYLNAPEYRQMIQEGLDPHAWMAAQIWGGKPEQYGKGSDLEKKRSEAKNVLFAIVYGAGARRVADMLNIPYSDSRVLVEAIKDALPRYRTLASTRQPMGRIPRKIKRDGYVTTLMGRKQIVPKEKAYVGLNSLIQGSAADIFKAGTIATAKAVESLGAYPILFVHDEIVVECPIESAEECLALTKGSLKGAFDLNPTLEVSGSIAYKNYAEGK